MRTLIFGLAALGQAIPALAHVDWSQVNTLDPDCLALYHFDTAIGVPGGLLEVAAGLPAGRGMAIGATAGTSMSTGSDTPEAIFAPRSLFLNSTQNAESTSTLTHLDGDLTIEFWFKWDSSLTSQSISVGLRSGTKLTIARDEANHANDRMGLTFTHGDFQSAPGFTNWADVGDEEGSLDEWRHVAVTIHSTGMHHDEGLGHDVYNSGTVARIYLNGHATGSAPHTIDLTDMRVHGASTIRIVNVGGGIKIDELTLWSRDLSNNGSVSSPFSNGRGTASTAPRIAATPDMLSFTADSGFAVNVEHGGAPTSQNVEIQNYGNTTLNVTGLALMGTNSVDFALQSPPGLPAQIAPDSSIPVTVVFDPTQSVETLGLSAMLRITSNDASNTTIDVPLLADAIPVELSSFTVE